jgi:transmembrane sensor
MTSKNEPMTDDGLAEEAASWLLTLQSEELSAAQSAEFVDWLRQSPRHISEVLRICQLQRDLANFRGWSKSALAAEAKVTNVIQLVTARQTMRTPRRSRRPYKVALIAAGVAALCISGLLALTRQGQTEYRTSQGERHEMTLADGSVVRMAPQSDVVVRYRPHERLITLKRGEAQFHVAKNANRPFVVQAALTRVRAVGTVFNVEYGRQGVSVAVVEGRVAVSQRTTGSSAQSVSESEKPLLSLEASEEVSITPAGVASAVRRVRGQGEVAWASDRLTFENETVAEVIRRFNALNSVKVEIVDSGLAARRISGVFDAGDPQSFVAFIEAAANVQARQEDANHIILGLP